MSGIANLAELIDIIQLRQARMVDYTTAKSLEETLDLLTLLIRYAEMEPSEDRKQNIKQVLHDLKWLDSETLLRATSEELKRGVYKLIQTVLER